MFVVIFINQYSVVAHSTRCNAVLLMQYEIKKDNVVHYLLYSYIDSLVLAVHLLQEGV
jgi:hypothetical protein